MSSEEKKADEMTPLTASTTTSSTLTTTPLTSGNKPIMIGEFQLQVPLAIGTLQWGTTWLDDRVINRTGALTEDSCREIVETIRGGGITLIDTAEGYGGGTSEKRLGRLFVQEDKPEAYLPALLMTKFLPAPWRAFESDFEWAVRQSCRRLQVDCIPIYLLHSPVHWRPIEFWVRAAARCKAKGLLHSMGLSNANAVQVRRAVQAGKEYGVPIVCNQVHYSLLDYKSPNLQEMHRVCDELGVTIVAFSPIGQGLLTDNLTDEKYASNKPAKMLRLKRSDLEPLRAVLSKLATKYDKSMAQISLNWCMQKGVVPLVGCRSPAQARDSMGSLGWNLEAADIAELDDQALDRSTLASPGWRRAFFVSLFGMVNIVCRTLDYLGLATYGMK